MRRWWMVLALGGALAGFGCEQRQEGAEQGEQLEGVEEEDVREGPGEVQEELGELREDLGETLEETEERAEGIQEELAEGQIGAERTEVQEGTAQTQQPEG